MGFSQIFYRVLGAFRGRHYSGVFVVRAFFLEAAPVPGGKWSINAVFCTAVNRAEGQSHVMVSPLVWRPRYGRSPAADRVSSTPGLRGQGLVFLSRTNCTGVCRLSVFLLEFPDVRSDTQVVSLPVGCPLGSAKFG